MFGRRRRRSRAAPGTFFTPVVGEPVDVVALAAGDRPVRTEGDPLPGDVPVQGEPIADGDGRIVNGWTPGDRPMRPVAAEGRPTSPPPKPSDVRRGRRWWLRRTSAPRPEDRPVGPPPPYVPGSERIARPPWSEGWQGQHVVTTACPRCGCPIGVVDASERKGSR